MRSEREEHKVDDGASFVLDGDAHEKTPGLSLD